MRLKLEFKQPLVSFFMRNYVTLYITFYNFYNLKMSLREKVN